MTTPAAPPVTFTVWSDFLCPWCYVTAVRLAAVKTLAGSALRVEWRAFLLRPAPEVRDPERFRRYTASWSRPAAAEPGAAFRPWASEESPPSHSVPPAVAGKVAASFGADAFDRFHLALMRAYFSDNRTISEPAVILEVAAAVGLDPQEFAFRFADGDGTLAAAVVADHEDALRRGIAAVPTVVVDDEYVLTGAMATEQYSKIVARLGG